MIDGDTFEVAGGRTVRVLGIDSCEAGTDGGERATSAARAGLSGATVTLTREPGADRDRYDRELRYVATAGGGDFGEYMVAGDHTAVYAGRNDASAAYVARLRSLDTNARTCENPTPAAPVSTGGDDADSRRNVPSADRPAPSGGSSSGGAAYYPNCSAARAAGAAPLSTGQPGYSAKLDRDGDGVACE